MSRINTPDANLKGGIHVDRLAVTTFDGVAGELLHCVADFETGLGYVVFGSSNRDRASREPRLGPRTAQCIASQVRNRMALPQAGSEPLTHSKPS